MTTPIRLTIIPDDCYCAVDGIGYSGIDMTSLAAEIHAMQWYGERGEEEIKDLSTGRIVHNKEITSLNDYQVLFILNVDASITQYVSTLIPVPRSVF